MAILFVPFAGLVGLTVMGIVKPINAGNDIHLPTKAYKVLIQNRNELNNGFQITKYLTWYRMPPGIKNRF